MSSDVTGRRSATSRTAQGSTERAIGPGVTSPCVDAPAEVLEFIRYCYRRRGIGWPELYDEMCGVAARGSYRGMDYDALSALGIGFSLQELPRLAALSGRVVAEERGARAAAQGGVMADVVVMPEGGATGEGGGGTDTGPVLALEPNRAGDEASRVRAAMIAATAG